MTPSALQPAFIYESPPLLHPGRSQQRISALAAIATAAGGVASRRRTLKPLLGKTATAFPRAHSKKNRRSTCLCQSASSREVQARDDLQRLRRLCPAYDCVDPVLVPACPPGTISVPALEEEIVFCIVRDFLEEHLVGGPPSLVISLSGGVDSMVLAFCLRALMPSMELGLSAVHVDYGLREVSRQEAEFVLAWTKEACFPCYLVQLCRNGDERRNGFEARSRRARYDAYRRAVSMHSATAVVIGHHRDDAAENILDNLARGRSLFDIPVMPQKATIEGVHIWRPMAALSKREIRAFAHRQSVPHLLDNDEPGSSRITWREKVFPALEQEFGHGTLHNIVRVGSNMLAWGTMVDNLIIEPFLRDVRQYTYGAVVPFGAHGNSPLAFWEEALKHVMHGLRVGMLKRGSLDILVKRLARLKPSYLRLHKVFTAYIDPENHQIVFIDSRLMLERDQSTGVQGAVKPWKLDLTWEETCHQDRWNLPGLLSGSLETPVCRNAPHRQQRRTRSSSDLPPALLGRLPSAADCNGLPSLDAAAGDHGSRHLILRMTARLDDKGCS